MTIALMFPRLLINGIRRVGHRGLSDFSPAAVPMALARVRSTMTWSSTKTAPAHLIRRRMRQQERRVYPKMNSIAPVVLSLWWNQQPFNAASVFAARAWRIGILGLTPNGLVLNVDKAGMATRKPMSFY